MPDAAVPKRARRKAPEREQKARRKSRAWARTKEKKEGIENQICYRFQRGKCFETLCPRMHICNRCGSHLHGEKECKMPKPAVA